MRTRTDYRVKLSHPNYPKLDGPLTITVTSDKPGVCFCNSPGMGCSRDYEMSPKQAIEAFAAEHGAEVCEDGITRITPLTHAERIAAICDSIRVTLSRIEAAARDNDKPQHDYEQLLKDIDTEADQITQVMRIEARRRGLPLR